MTDVWAATDALAAETARSPHLSVFRDGLKQKPAREGSTELIGSVGHLLVYYSTFQSQPLLVGLRLGHVPEFGPLHRDSLEVRNWFEGAQRFAFAFVDIVEFLRSRLPGYPGILVPELCPGAARVAHDGIWDMRMPWMAEVRRAGLQLQARPTMPAEALDLPNGGHEFLAATTALIEALRATSTWTRFEAAHQGLDEDARGEAKQLRKEFRQAVNEDRIDEIAGTTAMRSQQMRRTEMESVKARATGATREYFEAFDGVDELIDAVAAFITHRIARGEIKEVEVISAEWGQPGDLRDLRIEAAVGGFFKPYELVRVPSALPELAGILLLHNMTMQLDRELLVADGRFLAGSGSIPSAWS